MKIAVIEVAKKHFKLFGTSGNIIAFQWFFKSDKGRSRLLIDKNRLE